MMDMLPVFADERIQKMDIQITAIKDLLSKLEDERQAIKHEILTKQFDNMMSENEYLLRFDDLLKCTPEFARLVYRRTSVEYFKIGQTVYLSDYSPLTDTFSVSDGGYNRNSGNTFIGGIEPDMIITMHKAFWVEHPVKG